MEKKKHIANINSQKTQMETMRSGTFPPTTALWHGAPDTRWRFVAVSLLIWHLGLISFEDTSSSVHSTYATATTSFVSLQWSVCVCFSLFFNYYYY